MKFFWIKKSLILSESDVNQDLSQSGVIRFTDRFIAKVRLIKTPHQVFSSVVLSIKKINNYPALNSSAPGSFPTSCSGW
jgi:hypothetical protein